MRGTSRDSRRVSSSIRGTSCFGVISGGYNGDGGYGDNGFFVVNISRSSGNRVGEGAADVVTSPPTTHVDNMQTRTIPLSLVPRVDGDAPPFRDCKALNTRAVLGDVNVAPTTVKHAPGQFCYRQATSIMPRYRPRSLPGQDLPSYAAADVPRPAKMPDRGQVHVARVVTAITLAHGIAGRATKVNKDKIRYLHIPIICYLPKITRKQDVPPHRRGKASSSLTG
jgi:hypothetical protein